MSKPGQDKQKGAEAIALLGAFPALLAGAGGFVVGGPVAAVAAAAGTWTAVYKYLEPRTRPDENTGKVARSTVTVMSDDDIRHYYGSPDVYWNAQDAPAVLQGYIYGPEQFREPDSSDGVLFSFYMAAGTSRTTLVRVSGGDGYYLPGAVQRAITRAQRAAERRFQQAAAAAYRNWQRQTELAQQQAKEAAEADAAWIASVNADAARVVSELKAGRQAQMRDWWSSVQQNPARQRALTQAEAVLQAALAESEAARRKALEQAEREVREAQRQAVEAAAIAAEQARLAKLSRPIPLAPDRAGIVFGTRIKDGVDFVVPLAHLQHMLISGVTHAGKSVFMHALLHQLIPSDQVERLVLIDLKGGVSFNRYRYSPKVEVVYEMPEVMRVIDELMALMVQRQNHLRENGIEFWRGGRIFVVIDEYAEIQTEIDSADTKDAKAAARRLAANLASISRRARALGIVLVCALQRPTVDAMDAAVRNNLNCRICMRAATSQLAASMLEDLDELPVWPTELPNGEFYYYDASRGLTRLLKGQIALGVDLADDS